MGRLQEDVDALGQLGAAAGVLVGQRGAAARRAVGIEQDGTIVGDDEIELAIQRKNMVTRDSDKYTAAWER